MEVESRLVTKTDGVGGPHQQCQSMVTESQAREGSGIYCTPGGCCKWKLVFLNSQRTGFQIISPQRKGFNT